MDQFVESFPQAGLFVFDLDVTTAEGPLSVRRRGPGNDLTFGFDHGVAAHARRIGHRRLATSSETLGHGTGHDALLHLVQMGQDCREESPSSSRLTSTSLGYTARLTFGGP